MFAAVALWPFVLAVVVVRVLALDIFSDIGDAIWGGISSAFDAIKGFVVGIVRHFINFLSSVISFTTDVLFGAINFVAGQAYGLFQAVWSSLNYFVGVLWGLIIDARNFAVWLVDQAVGLINTVAGWAYAQFIHVFALIAQAVYDVLTWVVRNVWDVLHQLLDDVIHFVTVDIPHWVNGIVNNLWCFVRDVASSIGGIAAGVFNDLLGPFKSLLAAGLLAFKWIVWMAVHPFDWFTTLLADFVHHGSDWLVGLIAGAVEKNADTIDSWLARFFE